MDSYEYMPRQMAMRHNLVNRPAPAQVKSPDAGRAFPEKTPIGMAYVPVQQWAGIYEPGDAFCRGTVFPELDYPFGGGV